MLVCWFQLRFQKRKLAISLTRRQELKIAVTSIVQRHQKTTLRQTEDKEHGSCIFREHHVNCTVDSHELYHTLKVNDLHQSKIFVISHMLFNKFETFIHALCLILALSGQLCVDLPFSFPEILMFVERFLQELTALSLILDISFYLVGQQLLVVSPQPIFVKENESENK